jgi:GcrA cell cycle regulator
VGGHGSGGTRNPAWEVPGVLDYLRSAWAAGTSPAAIGAKIGFSRGAVIGKARRLKLGPHPVPSNSGRPRVEVLPPVLHAMLHTLPPLAASVAAEPKRLDMRAAAWATPAVKQKIYALWADGVSVSEIARRVSTPHRTVTRDMLSRQRRTLQLPGRPSPIKRAVPSAGRFFPVVNPTPLPPLVAAPAPVVAPPQTFTRSPSIEDGCVFPHGTPGRHDFRFCGRPVASRRSPYCEACRRVAYGPVRVHAEATA